MIGNKEMPEMFLFSQNRRDNLGVIKQHTDFKEDIRFGTASEISFSIPKMIYNTETYEWIENPTYKNLVKDNIIYLADKTNYFSFPNRTLRTDYSISSGNMGKRSSTIMSYNSNLGSGLTGFAVQQETKLFNVSVNSGFNFQNLSQISGTDGDYTQYSDWATKFPYVACTNFIPIEPYDVIAVRCRTSMGNYFSSYSNINSSTRFHSFNIYFYLDSDASTYVGSTSINYNSANPVYRFSINNLSNDIKTKMANGGYIRIAVEDGWNVNNYGDTSRSSYYYTDSSGTTHLGWSFPYDGWVQIYSGERRCTRVDNLNTSGTYDLPMRWFVIIDANEEDDGYMPIKTITAQSYEITLGNRSVSISEGMLPFYIPDKIVDLVNSSSWVIDKVDTKNSSNTTITSTRVAKQYMSRGLLNEIMDILPDWSIGHISSKLMTRYRQFDDADNVDIYSFLTDDVQQAYQCFFVFDNDKKTISAYTQEDILKSSNVILNWNNAIKNLKITNSSTNRVTGLRVHTADDAYGLGLVNPYGGNVIYNFNEVLDQMDFVADTSMNDPLKRNQILDENEEFVRFRTLKEAVESMQYFAQHPEATNIYTSYIKPFDGVGIPLNNLNDYYNCAKNFITANEEYIKTKTLASEFLSKFKAIVDRINTLIMDYHPNNYQDYILSDRPKTNLPTTLTSYSDYCGKGLYQEYRNAAQNYWDAYNDTKEVDSARIVDGDGTWRCPISTQKNLYYSGLREVSQKLNLNYYRQKRLIQKYPDGDTGLGYNPTSAQVAAKDEFSLLTPAEILALQPFIIEGDWTNENAVFSDTYGANDIIDTLKSVKEQATFDLDNYYSKYNYDFEVDMANWLALIEMNKQVEAIRVGQTLKLNTDDNKWVTPILLELHINYTDPNDFSMKFTTDYNRKVSQYTFSDLYDSISRVSTSDKQFTFNE